MMKQAITINNLANNASTKGFDLHHNIRSSYSNFSIWFKKRYIVMLITTTLVYLNMR
ncbi:MAG: hypothetical protein RRY39_10465 [Odoribacter sp.]